jgi:toxin CcdB
VARHDVYRLRQGELVVDCQSDIHRHLDTRFVIPAVSFEADYPVKPGLNPVLNCAGNKIVLVTEFASTVFVRDIAETIGSVESESDRVTRALDFLTGGF